MPECYLIDGSKKAITPIFLTEEEIKAKAAVNFSLNFQFYPGTMAILEGHAIDGYENYPGYFALLARWVPGQAFIVGINEKDEFTDAPIPFERLSALVTFSKEPMGGKNNPTASKH